MSDSTVTRNLTLDSREEAVILFGPRDEYLRTIRDALGVKLVARGDLLQIEGSPEAAEQAERAFQQLRQLLRKQGNSRPRTCGPSSKSSAAGPTAAANVTLMESGRGSAPRTDGQGRYVQALRTHDVVLCVGPAGTGKTYLAVGWAVGLLRSGQVKKIVLVRPAVEAGERLGFLPGDLVAKINPYLRPLFDALNDIMDPDTVKKYMESDIIEILPLAYMRGPNAFERLHHPRRGAERDDRPDEDVPDADGDELEDHRDRRPDADRPAAHGPQRPGRRGPPASKRRRAGDRLSRPDRHRPQPARYANREGLRGGRAALKEDPSS